MNCLFHCATCADRCLICCGPCIFGVWKGGRRLVKPSFLPITQHICIKILKKAYESADSQLLHREAMVYPPVHSVTGGCLFSLFYVALRKTARWEKQRAS